MNSQRPISPVLRRLAKADLASASTLGACPGSATPEARGGRQQKSSEGGVQIGTGRGAGLRRWRHQGNRRPSPTSDGAFSLVPVLLMAPRGRPGNQDQVSGHRSLSGSMQNLARIIAFLRMPSAGLQGLEVWARLVLRRPASPSPERVWLQARRVQTRSVLSGQLFEDPTSVF